MKDQEKVLRSYHPTAVVESSKIGEGTRIWHFAHVRENSRIGRDCNVGKDVYIDAGVEIGDRVKIQNFVSVYKGVVIEDDVFVGPSATFTNDLYPRAFVWGEDKVVSTLVKAGASIGANSTVICGVTIGEYAMVGAGSVVTRDVPPHGLVRGNPAKLVGWVCYCGRVLEEKEMEETGPGGPETKRPVSDGPHPATYKCISCKRTVKVGRETGRGWSH